jgi:hypothetical protein
MWNFSLMKAIGLVAQTAPFVVLRLLVYLGITLAYIAVTGTGAAVGFGFGNISSDPDTPFAGAFWGGLGGFGIVSAVLYLAREYILYLVKAAHIAVLVELLEGKSVPGGQNQIQYGTQFVKTHFVESSVLFGVDQIIKAVLKVITGTLTGVAAFLPIPALQTAINIFNSILRMSLTFVDEVILAYMIRQRTTNPWETAKDGLVLYAQNYGNLLKNAAWLTVFLWGLTILIFIFLLGPVAALLAFMPSVIGGWSFVFAFIFAWALKAAVLEPIAITALMQAYFKVIEGQKPDAEWDARLTNLSKRFRDLAGKAASWVAKPAPAAAQSAPQPG